MKTTETKLTDIKEVVMKFNINFDKRTRVGLPSCWDQQGNLLPQDTYESLLVQSKTKIIYTHERTIVLKGTTILNYLHRYFQLLWLMRTPFVDKKTYNMIRNFKMAHTRFFKSPSLDTTIWKKCGELMSPTTTIVEVGPSTEKPELTQ